MRSASTYLVHLLLQWPFWVVLALAFTTWRSFVQHTSAWRRLALLTVTLIAYIASIPATMSKGAAWLEGQSAVPTAETIARHSRGQEPRILVLSGGWFRLTEAGYVVVMGTASWERTAAGVKLWRQAGGRLYFTGAPLPDGRNSVAREMADVARQLGVPPERVAVEERSTNTRENMLFSAREFGLAPGTPVILVTSAVHMPRALVAARAAEWVVLPYPCDFRADTDLDWRSFLPSNEAPSSLEGLLHEALGLLQYRWRGWI